jgi:uncharacterized protein (TIGR00297 family)
MMPDMPNHWPTVPHLLLAAVLALLTTGAAKAVRALSWSGMAAAALVGFLLFGFGGGTGAAALLLFFVTSSALSRLGKHRKEALQFEKGGERDAGQVLANGGIAALCSLLLPLFPLNSWPIAALLGSLAAANADTWATEIGSLAKGKPRRITDFQIAETGESGAISLPGTLAALLGAGVLALISLFWGLGWRGVFCVTAGGFLGSLIDSLCGATIQEMYRDPVTGRLTEHPGNETDKYPRMRGIPGMNNDRVNTAATLCGALLSAVLMVV